MYGINSFIFFCTRLFSMVLSHSYPYRFGMASGGFRAEALYMGSSEICFCSWCMAFLPWPLRIYDILILYTT